jgi:ABC-type glycerol-3-phosphate transport system permease component
MIMEKKTNWRKLFKNIIIIGGLSFYLIIVIFPFYWLAFSSIKVLTDLFQPNILFPWQTNLTWFNYEFAATKAYPSLISLFLNSLYISIISVILTLVISTFGAYAVARMKFRGKAVVTNSILLIYFCFSLKTRSCSKRDRTNYSVPSTNGSSCPLYASRLFPNNSSRN